jgi:predicted esterase
MAGSKRKRPKKLLRQSMTMRIITSLFVVVYPIFIMFSWISCAKKKNSNYPVPVSATICNASTGYYKALDVCSASNPCSVETLSEELKSAYPSGITFSSPVPICNDSGSDDDGVPYSTTGIDGVMRYACIHKPTGGSTRPLIIWFHPGGNGLATNLYTETNLRKRADTYDLGGASPGYVIAAIQGRALHYPTDWPRDGFHHDFYFRSLGAPSQNPDISFTDALIDHIVSEGGIDANRIYVMGWSNGAMFAQLYAIARYGTATAGGNRVASAAVYSGGDPFDSINQGDNCQLNPYPSSTVPIKIIRRSCDGALACNPTQQTWFDTPPGHETEDWISIATTNVGTTPDVTTIDGFGAVVMTGCVSDINQCSLFYGAGTACASLSASECNNLGAILNHLRWPSGRHEGGAGADRESILLDFLKDHPL